MNNYDNYDVIIKRTLLKVFKKIIDWILNTFLN